MYLQIDSRYTHFGLDVVLRCRYLESETLLLGRLKKQKML